EVIRSLGQIATAEDVETAECAACISAIDAGWGTGDGSHFLISECRAPASGMIHVLADEDLPLVLGDDGGRAFVWTAAPSDDSSQVAFLGYQLGVADLAAAEGIDSSLTAVDLETLPVSNATWVPGEEAIRWLEGEADALHLRTYDVATGTSESVPVEGP